MWRVNNSTGHLLRSLFCCAARRVSTVQSIPVHIGPPANPLPLRIANLPRRIPCQEMHFARAGSRSVWRPTERWRTACTVRRGEGQLRNPTFKAPIDATAPMLIEISSFVSQAR